MDELGSGYYSVISEIEAPKEVMEPDVTDALTLAAKALNAARIALKSRDQSYHEMLVVEDCKMAIAAIDAEVARRAAEDQMIKEYDEDNPHELDPTEQSRIPHNPVPDAEATNSGVEGQDAAIARTGGATLPTGAHIKAIEGAAIALSHTGTGGEYACLIGGLEAAAVEVAWLTAALANAEENAHYANGVADLAMKHLERMKGREGEDIDRWDALTTEADKQRHYMRGYNAATRRYLARIHRA